MREVISLCLEELGDEDKALPEFVGVQKVMVNDQVTAS